MSFRQIRCVTHACYLCVSETEAFCSVIEAPAGARRRLSVSAEASSPKQQDIPKRIAPYREIYTLAFRLADRHATFFPLPSVQLAAEAQPRKSALFGRGRQRQVQRPDSGGEQQPDREALRDLRLSGESVEEGKKLPAFAS